MLPKLNNWQVLTTSDGNQCLIGNIYNDHRFGDGSAIQTSALVWFDAEGRRAKTNNTEYELGMPYMTEID